MPVVALRHGVTGVSPKAKLADVFLPAFVAGVSKHALEASRVAHPHSLPGDGPRLTPGCAPEGMLELQCCRPRGPALALWAPEGGGESLLLSKTAPMWHGSRPPAMTAHRARGTVHTEPCWLLWVQLQNMRRQRRGTWRSHPWPCHARDSQQLLRELQGGWWEHKNMALTPRLQAAAPQGFSKED